MNRQLEARHWVLLAAAALLAMAGTTIAGIQGTGLRAMAAFGTVDVDGGLHVNGVPYDTSHARVTVNGRPADVSQLKTGHIVALHGSLAKKSGAAIADEIVLESDLRGEITSVDEPAGVFTVLGQTIQLTDQTVVNAPIRSGLWVAVSAFERSDGRFEASRVDLEIAPTELQVRGVVHSLDRAHQILRIGELTVDYSAATPRGKVAEGAIVIARGVQPASSGALFATYVEVFSGVGNAGEHGDVRGLVTAFASSTDFEVDGQPVQADARTVYVLHGQSLGPDLQVRITGRFDATGVLIAHKVQADPPGHAAAKCRKSLNRNCAGR